MATRPRRGTRGLGEGSIAEGGRSSGTHLTWWVGVMRLWGGKCEEQDSTTDWDEPENSRKSLQRWCVWGRKLDLELPENSALVRRCLFTRSLYREEEMCPKQKEERQCGVDQAQFWWQKGRAQPQRRKKPMDFWMRSSKSWGQSWIVREAKEGYFGMVCSPE